MHRLKYREWLQRAWARMLKWYGKCTCVYCTVLTLSDMCQRHYVRASKHAFTTEELEIASFISADPQISFWNGWKASLLMNRALLVLLLLDFIFILLGLLPKLVVSRLLIPLHICILPMLPPSQVVFPPCRHQPQVTRITILCCLLQYMTVKWRSMVRFASIICGNS